MRLTLCAAAVSWRRACTRAVPTRLAAVPTRRESVAGSPRSRPRSATTGHLGWPAALVTQCVEVIKACDVVFVVDEWGENALRDEM